METSNRVQYWCAACAENDHRKCERYSDQWEGKRACQCVDSEHTALKLERETDMTAKSDQTDSDVLPDFSLPDDVARTTFDVSVKHGLSYTEGLILSALLRKNVTEVKVLVSMMPEPEWDALPQITFAPWPGDPSIFVCEKCRAHMYAGQIDHHIRTEHR